MNMVLHTPIGSWAYSQAYDDIVTLSARNPKFLYQDIDMHKLEKYYSGDADWNDLVKLYSEDYLDENAKILSEKLNSSLDLAIVIYGKRGLKEGEWWVKQEVPMLDGIRPLDCLGDPELLKRLRECLMRMP